MSESPHDLGELAARRELSIDHQLALRAASRRLRDEFSQSFTVETIEGFLAGSYEQFAATARFPNYVHLLAERYARARLTAFALTERHISDDRPIVLFVCSGNDVHSPMARGLLSKLAGDSVVAWSAGISPAVALKPGVEEVLHEVGVSLVDEFPKPLAREMLQAASMVVTFGCEADVEVIGGRTYLHARAPESRTPDVEGLRELRRWIETGVESVLASLPSAKRS